METAHERLRPPGDSGGHDDRLLTVATLLHKLDDEGLKPLDGLLGTVDFIGSALNPHGHRRNRLQSWLTHFALLLKYERDERVWLLQRHCHGVDYHPTDVPADALVMGAQITYAPDGPTATVCNVATRGTRLGHATYVGPPGAALERVGPLRRGAWPPVRLPGQELPAPRLRRPQVHARARAHQQEEL